MNTTLNEKIVELVKAHKWQELLRMLPPNEGVPLLFERVEDINNMRSVAARLNSMGQDANRYTFSGLNYITKVITAYATPKQTNDEPDTAAERL